MSVPIVYLVVLVAGLLVLSGAVLAAGMAQRRRERQAAAEDISRLESQIRELARANTRLRSEIQIQANVSRVLPSIARELNRSDLDPSEIPAQLFSLVEAAFAPEQILLFLTRAPGVSKGRATELYLREHRGLQDVPESHTRVRVGQGRIGWVADSKVEMAAEDWLNLSRTEGRTYEVDHPGFHLDLIGPLLHHRKEGDVLLGVLCVGKPSLRTRDEKTLLRMLTNLGALAYTNAANTRSLQRRAARDGLTDLLNKRAFMNEIGELIVTSGRTSKRIGILMFDIDHFKHYNDAHGHLAGDDVLRGVATVLRENLRPQDVAGRYGGEEFIIAMPETDRQEALQVAERIRAAIAAHPFPHAAEQPTGRLTISGGVAALPHDGENGTELIANADRALYKAKAAGRNRIFAHVGYEFSSAEPEGVPRYADR